MSHGVLVETEFDKIYYRNFSFRDIERAIYDDDMLHQAEMKMLHAEEDILFTLLAKAKEIELVDYWRLIEYYKEQVLYWNTLVDLTKQLWCDKVKIYDNSTGKYYVKKDGKVLEVNKEEYDNYILKEDL